MNTTIRSALRNTKLIEEVSRLTVAQAHRAFFHAVSDCNMVKADMLRQFLRLASKTLREALDFSRSEAQKIRAGFPSERYSALPKPEALAVLSTSQKNLLADLGRIKEVLDWQPEALHAPHGPTLGEALALAGLKLGERA